MEAPPVIETTPPPRTNTFARQLRFWSLHCGLTALPSFCIALTVFNGLPALLAMFCGVATFVLFYSVVTSTNLYGKVHSGLIGRSVKLGTRIRMIISVASLPLLIPIIGVEMDSVGEPPMTLMFTPDFWFGYLAIVLTVLALSAIIPNYMRGNGSLENMAEDFLFPYMTTLIEGVLISISLIFIAFITLVVLNFKRNRQRMPSQYFPQGPPAP